VNGFNSIFVIRDLLDFAEVEAKAEKKLSREEKACGELSS
jgi:inosine/xanthosine triphosphate pyrophosphatase family protein